MKTDEFTQEDKELIQREFEPLRIASLKRCADQEQYELVLKAFDFANKAHYGVRRRSGEPYIIHPIAVARIVVQEIGLGCKSICAALLHDVVEDTDYTVEDIRREFSDRIALLVDGLTKIKTALDSEKGVIEERSQQADNFKRVLLTLNDDARIVLIKLADRLHNMRTIEYMPAYKREKILSETMYIFIPLAHRLGLNNIKSEMENIWLKNKEAQAYADIEKMLAKATLEKGPIIDNFIAPVEKILKDAGFKCRIIKRMKTPYSIWKKMTTKNIPFEEIFDIYAVRIIFEPRTDVDATERDQCWHIFSLITSHYRYKPERTRDWVSAPKLNGYEALHLTLISEGTWIEVQIRSERMNAIAESGVAAHWSYKQSHPEDTIERDRDIDTWIKGVKDILDNPDANALQFLDNFHEELTSGEMFAFTPQGESISIPKGSTALDFAYYIHSAIGNKAIAAKVNMKLVSLSTVLNNGDQVEIITSDNAKPKREWLDFLVTSRARNQVLLSMKSINKDNIQSGIDILKKKLAERNIILQARVIRKLIAYYKMNNKEELYNRIGIGIIDLEDLDDALKSNARKRDVQMWGIKLLSPIKNDGKIDKSKDYLLEEDFDKGTISFHTADCCRPIPGDNVVGVVNGDGSVTIHKTSCEVFTDFAATNGDKIVSVKWSKHFMMSYLTQITIRGIDRIGILNEITKEISLVLEVNIRKIVIEAHDEVFEGYIDLYVHNTDDLDHLMERLGNIRGVESVLRTNIEDE
ncbi:MAG: bifunctional (p)ppGpp synthetase/guanosine-3',5'-bis(diphosphate) 3'-pyrophosphohydrolase [Bacteroidales bacterium]|nr:bifunctional (p)ppGpp synthetase/guanosine-3',5'-bis(diphosphate) 3'-pyrophosphohydrolase [Bacteroidales bacterium]MBO7487448.1 bifunctional (p)ppGpp synthetase/guanosine-3',5'-bis(diphosphate) 3'-pyrophosphohydrolase [Bacteroidales bacterium]